MLAQEEKYELESLIDDIKARIEKAKKDIGNARFMRWYDQEIKCRRELEDLLDVLSKYQRRLKDG
jgi:hypothetical protein